MATPDHLPVILAVDRNRRNLELLARVVEREGYRVRPASTLEEFDLLLGALELVSLVLIDLSGFDRRIWERCEQLRRTNTPFLVISPRHSDALRQESMGYGALNVLVKPVVIRELLTTIHSLVRR